MAHPLLTVLARAHVRQGLRAKGYGFAEAFQLAQTVDDELVSVAESQLAAAPAFASEAVGGPILDAIIAFLKSDAGMALITLIIKLLLGGL